ncbi:hypothetical protein KC356_g8387 [Hortaea werneckii]|nr:hypothetical protein KC356_g8387 [Hortaea werneckii]
MGSSAIIFYRSRRNDRPYATPAPPRQQQQQQQQAESLLAQQRLRRPLSPHLTIYKWEITSVLSSLMRITGVTLSASLYIFGASYLASPYLGLDLSSSAIAAAFGNLPAAVRYPIKFMVSWLLTFHSFNALRYLSWDMTIGINNKQIARTGWTMAIASVAAAFGLTAFV